MGANGTAEMEVSVSDRRFIGLTSAAPEQVWSCNKKQPRICPGEAVKYFKEFLAVIFLVILQFFHILLNSK